MIKQCFCNEVEPCAADYLSHMLPCADQCQNRAAALGANYAALRECIASTQSGVRGATECVWKSIPDS
ncbi:unnamed protein product [Toxocara canis]|nr:unnamed protein product [Toxocara canis]